MRLQIALPVKLVGHAAKLVIPFFAKTTRERLFQELVDRQMKTATFLAGRTADVPLVIVQGYGAVAESFFADRVEGAANGFDKGMDG